MSKQRLMRAVVCAALIFAAAVLVAGRRGAVTKAAQVPQADRPVEQTAKNIQVLKGLPSSQLSPLMNFISVSLGVRCNYCHVTQGKDPKTGNTIWVWESDDKQEKKTARQMMQMVLALNHSQGYGLDPGEISCYTCHRGSTRPQSLPALPLAAPSPQPSPAPSPAGQPAPRPSPLTVQQVYEKYVAAVGGESAAAKFQTMTVKGTRDASQGRSWPFVASEKGPDKLVVTVEVPQQGTIIQAINGTSGWTKNPRETRALSPAEFAELKRGAALLSVIKFRPTATMRSIGQRKVGDRDALVVVDRPSEGVSRRYFFDAQTGLLFRITTITDTMLSPLPEQIDFEDYRDIEGVKIPFVTRVSTTDASNSYSRTITEVSHGNVEDRQFDMPPAQPPKQ
jgi:Photosynthetic reaction centre cytochrome C subunit